MSSYQNISNEEKKKEECLICIEVLDGEISESSCGHIYHYSCIQKWIVEKGTHRCCCVCEDNTEIVNIINFNNSFDEFKKVEMIEKNTGCCCSIL